ncbi:MAG TPA: formyltransferase [Steroidobacteraceae bacterium]|nr:formyltransferase [Steroidobacteraceae bacterium]
MSAPAPRAVVFAYHDVGVRCLRTLLAHGVQVPLVVTHADDPGETIWFESVARHAAWHGLPVRQVQDARGAQLLEAVRTAQPDFLFSFYFRAMLPGQLLASAARGAYNMHGSLLPRYRGRAPVNWAVLHGERETGATLHAMIGEPDAGPIVAQRAVPILPDDTAIEVFRKVTVAAECALHDCLPSLLAGSAAHVPQDPAAASYFGRRTARDGSIDWQLGALAAHNLIRAVAPPYPGAFSRAGGEPLRIRRSLLGPAGLTAAQPSLCQRAGDVYALCPDGAVKLLDFELGSHVRDAAAFRRRFGERAVPLEPAMEAT